MLYTSIKMQMKHRSNLIKKDAAIHYFAHNKSHSANKNKKFFVRSKQLKISIQNKFTTNSFLSQIKE